MTQQDLAHQVGYEQAHVSALELGNKNPGQEFLERLVKALKLSDEDRLEMEVELAASRNRFALPPTASTETFRFCSDLWEKIDRLHPAALQGMHALLTIEEEVTSLPRHQPTRLRRRHFKETQM